MFQLTRPSYLKEKRRKWHYFAFLCADWCCCFDFIHDFLVRQVMHRRRRPLTNANLCIFLCDHWWYTVSSVLTSFIFKSQKCNCENSSRSRFNAMLHKNSIGSCARSITISPRNVSQPVPLAFRLPVKLFWLLCFLLLNVFIVPLTCMPSYNQLLKPLCPHTWTKYIQALQLRSRARFDLTVHYRPTISIHSSCFVYGFIHFEARESITLARMQLFTSHFGGVEKTICSPFLWTNNIAN